jgi:hypothetical protein
MARAIPAITAPIAPPALGATVASGARQPA